MKDKYLFKQIPVIALPLILSNLTVPLLGLVTTAVMGHLSSANYLAAVGIGAIIFDTIFNVFNFLRMATTGVVAQAHGRGEEREVALYLLRGIFLALLIGVLLIVLQKPLLQLSITIMHPNNTVAELLKRYFLIRIYVAPATLCVYAFVGWFIGIHRPRYALYLMLITNVIATALSLLFVYGLQLNVGGVAAAIVVAQYMALTYAVWQAARVHPSLYQYVRDIFTDFTRIKALLHLNKNIMIRTICLMSVFFSFTAFGSRLGHLTLAANVVLMNFSILSAYALDGFANAAEILVGKALGKQSRSDFFASIRYTLYWSVLIAAAICVVYFVIGIPLVHLLTSIESVRETVKHYFLWAIFVPLVSVLSFWADGVFIGATWGKAMRNVMVLSVLFYFLVWYATRGWGNNGLWFAFYAFFIMRGALMVLSLLKRIRH
tara:strand:+ start:78920 stop:80218 length:1299 start_codon:yes stop_codon:yes gene_type:complete